MVCFWPDRRRPLSSEQSPAVRCLVFCGKACAVCDELWLGWGERESGLIVDVQVNPDEVIVPIRASDVPHGIHWRIPAT